MHLYVYDTTAMGVANTTTNLRIKTVRYGPAQSMLMFVHACMGWVGDDLHSFVARGLLHRLNPLAAIVLQIIHVCRVQIN